MTFWNNLANAVGIRVIESPLVRKDIEESNLLLQQMYQLWLRVDEEKKREEIAKDMLLFQIGLDGEKSVMFELQNSNVPMVILHDIRVVSGGQAAQIDFVVITHHGIVLLETKKLQGDIEITADGDFIRYYKNASGKVYKKEGLYSPIAQNQRHVDVVKRLLTGARLIKAEPIYSKVVIASPKTIINKAKAPKEIAMNIHKADQLASVLKKLGEKGQPMREETMINVYKYLLGKHTPQEYDLLSRYNLEKGGLKSEVPLPSIEETTEFMRKMKQNSYESYKSTQGAAPIKEVAPKLESKQTDSRDLEGELKQYRTKRAKAEGIPPYFIFSDGELQDLLKTLPKSIHELGKIKGFGAKKIDKFGEDIIRILNN